MPSRSDERFGLSHEIIKRIASVFRAHSKVEKVVLYGSRAKGNYKSGSDIDLTMVGPGLDTTELLKIENELDDLLLPYKIDLSILHKIENSDLVEHIHRVGQEFWSRDSQNATSG